MNTKLNKTTLDRIVRRVAGRKYIFGAVFNVVAADNELNFISAAGEIGGNDRYYIASVNKFFLSAIVLRYFAEQRIDLREPIAKYLPAAVVTGLHRFRGTDYSHELTITHLLALTSGLPCYLADRQGDGKRAMKELEAGIDQAWPIERVVETVKSMPPHFPPGTPGRARYGDSNHQILSLLIEAVAKKPVQAVLTDLFAELDMRDTFVIDAATSENFVPIRHRAGIVRLPRFLASTQTDLASTARDQMTFLRAFFEGRLFPQGLLGELARWNRIFFPFQYGIGIQRFTMPRILSPFQRVPEMLGHCGSTGSVAFFIPDRNLYITGTVNQQAKPNVAFQAMIKILAQTG